MMTDQPLTFAIFGNSFQPRKSTSLLRVLSFLKSRGERVMFDREFYDFSRRSICSTSLVWKCSMATTSMPTSSSRWVATAHSLRLRCV